MAPANKDSAVLRPSQVAEMAARYPWRQVNCPLCGAEPGELCNREDPHQERVVAAWRWVGLEVKLAKARAERKADERRQKAKTAPNQPAKVRAGRKADERRQKAKTASNQPAKVRAGRKANKRRRKAPTATDQPRYCYHCGQLRDRSDRAVCRSCGGVVWVYVSSAQPVTKPATKPATKPKPRAARSVRSYRATYTLDRDSVHAATGAFVSRKQPEREIVLRAGSPARARELALERAPLHCRLISVKPINAKGGSVYATLSAFETNRRRH
jgi:hypothetical protein